MLKSLNDRRTFAKTFRDFEKIHYPLAIPILCPKTIKGLWSDPKVQHVLENYGYPWLENLAQYRALLEQLLLLW